MNIGGLIPIKTSERRSSYPLPFGSSDQRTMMSGRCAITYVLRDFLASKNPTQPLTAYFPAYTCETVQAPFLKLGFTLRYYPVDEKLVPHFSSEGLRSDLVLLTGYYGVPTYEQGSIDDVPIRSADELSQTIRENGTALLFDLTHTFFHDQPLPQHWDYAVVSLRKWMGIAAGGIAFKRASAFSLEPLAADLCHLEARQKALALARELEGCQDRLQQRQLQAALDTIFWDAEYRLRKTFDHYQSDPASDAILSHFDYTRLKERRRKNISLLTSLLPESLQVQGKTLWRQAFPALNDAVCPSHFSLLSDVRAELKDALEAQGVHTKLFWPPLPGLPPAFAAEASKITSKILSLPIDQECTEEDMRHLADLLLTFRPASLQ